MPSFRELFPRPHSLIAMIHVGALPGTPAYGGDDQVLIRNAIGEAILYRQAGVDGLILENMHDTPYLAREVGPEITAMMAVIGYEVKRASGLPCGVQILAGANRAALAVAKAAGLDFIRAEGFVFGHLADEGFLQSDAGDLLRYRRAIGAEGIAVWTDIKKKHSAHAVTADVDLAETARAAAFFRSDALIVTGTATGAATRPEDLEQVKGATPLPVIVGSGVTAVNLHQYLPAADGIIVGSALKKDGHWANPPDEKRVRELVALLR